MIDKEVMGLEVQVTVHEEQDGQCQLQMTFGTFENVDFAQSFLDWVRGALERQLEADRGYEETLQ